MSQNSHILIRISFEGVKTTELTGQRRETLKLVVAISLSGSAVSFSLTVIGKKKRFILQMI